MSRPVDPQQLDYPFDPKTNTNLVAGHFFGMDMINGQWTCGRVLTTGRFTGGRAGTRVTIVVGIHNWVSTERPTSELVAGLDDYHVLKTVHVKAIRAFGWMIDGWAPLGDTDFPERLSLPVLGAKVFKGGVEVRDATKEDLRNIPLMSHGNFPSLWYTINRDLGGTDKETSVAAMHERRAEVAAQRVAT